MITSGEVTFEKFCFPGGEMHIKIKDAYLEKGAGLAFYFEKNEDIIELLLLVDAIKRLDNGYINRLVIPYVPFARQDRVNVSGECFSLKVFCDLINSIGAKEVIIHDPHSDVTPALLNRCSVIKQWNLLLGSGAFLKRECGVINFSLPQDSDFWLISPDAGAMKKTYELAAHLPCLGVIECAKHRDVTNGKITGTIVHHDDFAGKTCFIVDDICDGGRTFIEIAKVLKTKNAGKVVLVVTHGLFTKGLDVFDGLIDEVWTAKGKVK